MVSILLVCAACGGGGAGDPPHVHTPGAAATCVTARTCTDCGEVLQAALGHDWDDDEAHWVHTAATCTHPEGDKTHCLRESCEEIDIRNAEGSPLGHDWHWQVTTAATLVSEGVDTETCAHDAAHTRNTRASFIPIVTAPNWTSAVALITAGTSEVPKKYTLTIGGNFSLDGRTTGSSFGGASPIQFIEVTLKGSGTMSIGAADGNLLRLAANQKLIIDGDREGTTDKLILKGKAANSGPLVWVGSATLELKNGAISGNTVASADWGGGVNSSGTFTMSGGTISGNTANAGGGVSSSGTFTLTSGTISGNTSSGLVGGVVINGGTFTMTGGTISGNTGGGGGGVYVPFVKTFTMTGGTISGNSGSHGGGVYVDTIGTFTMTGGAISGNTANQGGGVCARDGTFNMSSGTISGNTASGTGGGVFINGVIFTKSGGTINGGGVSVPPDNKATSSGHAVYWFNSSRYRDGTSGTGHHICTGCSLHPGSPQGWE